MYKYFLIAITGIVGSLFLIQYLGPILAGTIGGIWGTIWMIIGLEVRRPSRIFPDKFYRFFR